jgi:hypothetical protein
MHENRETSGTSRSNQDRDRPEKANSRTADRHVAEESDRAIVPVNLSNKEGQTSAEIGEGRERAKEMDCTPKMRQRVKGRPTLNGEVYGCGPENLQPRFEDRGDAGN